MSASTTESMMREGRVGVVGRRLGDGVTEEEADADDEAVAFVDEALHALGAVAVTGRGGFAAGDAEFGDGLVEACTGSVVERAVAAAGDVVHHADGAVALGHGVGGVRGGGAIGRLGALGCFGRVRRVGRRTSGVVVASACCQAECGDDADGEQLLALDHVLPFRMKCVGS